MPKLIASDYKNDKVISLSIRAMPLNCYPSSSFRSQIEQARGLKSTGVPLSRRQIEHLCFVESSAEYKLTMLGRVLGRVKIYELFSNLNKHCSILLKWNILDTKNVYIYNIINM